MSVRFRLKSCVWEITLACCYSCRHCGSRAGRARENELTTTECLDVVRQLKDLGCRRVNLIGGEVFMRSDWAEVVGAITSSGMNCAIITNGYDFSPEHIDKLKAVRIESVAVSIDGVREVHDYLRMEGSYDRALAAVDALSGAGIPVSVITTLNSMNIDCLDDMYEELADRDIFAWQLQACSPMGNASGLGIDYDFDHLKAVRFVEKHLADDGFDIGVADNIGYFSESEGSIRGNRSGLAYFKGCSAGLASIGIDSVGNVRGCESMYDERFNEGNLREKSLRDIWEDPEAFKYNRCFTGELLSGTCKNCEKGMFCAGGCRSYNYFTTGNLYEHPNCVYPKAAGIKENG